MMSFFQLVCFFKTSYAKCTNGHGAHACVYRYAHAACEHSCNIACMHACMDRCVCIRDLQIRVQVFVFFSRDSCFYISFFLGRCWCGPAPCKQSHRSRQTFAMCSWLHIMHHFGKRDQCWEHFRFYMISLSKLCLKTTSFNNYFTFTLRLMHNSTPVPTSVCDVHHF